MEAPIVEAVPPPPAPPSLLPQFSEQQLEQQQSAQQPNWQQCLDHAIPAGMRLLYPLCRSVNAPFIPACSLPYPLCSSVNAPFTSLLCSSYLPLSPLNSHQHPRSPGQKL
jgi:hypothetical protein